MGAGWRAYARERAEARDALKAEQAEKAEEARLEHETQRDEIRNKNLEEINMLRIQLDSQARA